MVYAILILSVLFGTFLVLLLNPDKKYIKFLLAFSGSYLLAVTVLHLLPEVYTDAHSHSHHHHAEPKIIGILILAGVLVQSILEFFSKGAEHGHVHTHSDTKEFPVLLFISLCIHAFSEGLPIHNTNENLLWAIVVHKIPIGIVLTSFFLHSKYAKKATILFLVIFSLMSPLGYFLGKNIHWFEHNHDKITAFIIGVFLHISTIILFESSENHKFDYKKFTAVVLGIVLAFFTLH